MPDIVVATILSIVSTHTPIKEQGLYFVTFTCYEWLPLIERTNVYSVFYKWFDLLQTRKHLILGYVLMPNHVHLLLYFDGGERTLNLEISSAKRFIAYEIVKALQAKKELVLLHKLKAGVCAKDKSRNKKHQVWQGSFDVKQCRTESFVLQKLQYIHRNPLKEHWNLATSSINFLHSSARFYITGKHSIYNVTDYRIVLAGISMKK